MSQLNTLRALNKYTDGVKKTDQFLIDPRTIEEEAGFNVRDTFDPDYWNRPEVIAHIRGFAESYKSGKYVPPMVVKVKNGVPLLRAGAHRLRGVMLAISEGAAIETVAVAESRGDEIDETILIAKENGGQALSPLSLAVIYGRLEGWGWTLQRIGAEFGATSEHVRQTIKLLDFPVALKRLICDGVVSASYALELFNEHGDGAVAIINDAASKQKAEQASSPAKGEKEKKVRVTKSSVNQGPRFTKKVVSQLHTQFVSLTTKLDSAKTESDGSVTLTLQPDELAALLELKAALDGKAAPAADASEEQLDLLNEAQ